MVPRRGVLMRFRRHGSGVRARRKQAPVHLVEAGAIVWGALGAPSAELSLGGLHACRARRRFTRHTNVSHAWRQARRRQKRLRMAKAKLKPSASRTKESV